MMSKITVKVSTGYLRSPSHKPPIITSRNGRLSFIIIVFLGYQHLISACHHVIRCSVVGGVEERYAVTPLIALLSRLQKYTVKTRYRHAWRVRRGIWSL